MRRCKGCNRLILFHRFRKCKCYMCQYLCRDCTDDYISDVLSDVIINELKPFEPLEEKTTAELMKETLEEIDPHLKDRIVIMNNKDSLLKEVKDFFKDKSKKVD